MALAQSHIRAAERDLSAAPWMRMAFAHEGLEEIDAQGELADAVRAFFSHTRFPLALVNRRTSWCAAYACTVLESAGIRSPKSARARDFLAWGMPLTRPIFGAVLIFERPTFVGVSVLPEWRAHVGFCSSHPTRDAINVACFGGNQGNRVCEVPKPVKALLGVRWPPGYPVAWDAR
jgi:uncharacterized protein (TIGR02594 family)